MNSIVLVALCSTLAYGAKLNSYLPPRPGAGAGGGVISAPTFGGGGAAAPSGPVIPIVSYENMPNKGDGIYSYSYQTGNNINAEEKGRGGPGPMDGTSAQGSYSYTGPDGQTYSITYTADANGFRPQGAHLPTPPPIPEEILKSLQMTAQSGGSGGGAGGSRSYLPPTRG